jgi:alpha-beta hydrolase superfamily lysophospholipase
LTARPFRPILGRMRTTTAAGLAAVILVATGCGMVLMKTPAAVSSGKLDPFARVIPGRQNSEAPVFVAAARTVSGQSEPTRFYTNERSRALRLGLAKVQIGPGMTWTDLVRESRAAKRQDNPPLAVSAYEEFGPLWSTVWPPDLRFHRDWDPPDADREPARRFVAGIEAMLRDSRQRQITIYVHGFNTQFGDNLMLAGEFWHYMARDDVMISFDWASRGSLFSYQVDKANADFAVRQLRRLLEFLAASTTASRIDIIGHSAGCVVVAEALHQLSLMAYDVDAQEAQRRTRIGRVVLAAPDMDLGTALSARVDGAQRVTQDLAVYASRNDRALSFSGNIFGDVRLGSSIGKLKEDERAAMISTGAQMIDVSPAQRWTSSFLGHSYYHQNLWVSSDVMLFLEVGATPEERGLVRDLETGFLTFPDGYLQQLPDIVDRLSKKYDFARPAVR